MPGAAPTQIHTMRRAAVLSVAAALVSPVALAILVLMVPYSALLKSTLPTYLGLPTLPALPAAPPLYLFTYFYLPTIPTQPALPTCFTYSSCSTYLGGP